MIKETTLTIRLSPAEKRELSRLSINADRSMASYIINKLKLNKAPNIR